VCWNQLPHIECEKKLIYLFILFGTDVISYHNVDGNVIEDYCLSSLSSEGAFEDDLCDSDKIPWLDEVTGYMYKKYIYLKR